MLGNILRSLTDPAVAEAALLQLDNAAIVHQVRDDAGAMGITVGDFVARAVRHVLDHAGEEVWLSLLGAMARTPEPGAAALRIILNRALPKSQPGSGTSRQPSDAVQKP